MNVSRQGPSQNEKKLYDDPILEINEFIIQKGNVSITFFISKTRNNLIIRSVSFELKITVNDFSIMTQQMFRTVDEAYGFIKNIFDNKNITIRDVSAKMMVILLSYYHSKNIGKREIEIHIPSLNDINGYIQNDLFSKYIKLEDNMNIVKEKNKQLMEENLKRKEENLKLIDENSKLKAEIIKIKNELAQFQIKNNTNENHVNLLLSRIDKINNLIDNIDKLRNANPSENNNEEMQNKASLSKSVAVNQNVMLKNGVFQQQANLSQTNALSNDNEKNEQNLSIYGEEQLFRTEDGRVIFRNGLLNGIIKKYSEINNVVNQIQEKLKKGVKFTIVYKAAELGDKASVFHQKCDSLEMSLVLIETKKGIRFGGFTSRSWEGNCVQKIDNSAFVFSIDKKMIYDIIPNEPAVGCYPKFGPVFFGCQIRIYDNFFSKVSTTCPQRLNYKTTQDYELNNGEQSFMVKDIEVYGIEAIDI